MTAKTRFGRVNMNKKVYLKKISANKNRVIKQSVPKVVNIEGQIIKLVCREFDVTYEEITGKNRKRVFVDPRQIAMKLIKDNSHKTLKQIGELFSNRDHSTVIHAVETANILIEQIPKIKRSYNNLVRDINEKIFKRKDVCI